MTSLACESDDPGRVHSEFRAGQYWVIVGKAEFNLSEILNARKAKERAEMADTLVFQAVLNHGLPWTIEHDWTYEVTARDGYTVAKCMEEGEAQRIIAFAEEVGRRDHA